ASLTNAEVTARYVSGEINMLLSIKLPKSAWPGTTRKREGIEYQTTKIIRKQSPREREECGCCGGRSYPLQAVGVDFTEKVAIKEARTKKWQLMIASILASQVHHP